MLLKVKAILLESALLKAQSVLSGWWLEVEESAESVRDVINVSEKVSFSNSISQWSGEFQEKEQRTRSPFRTHGTQTYSRLPATQDTLWSTYADKLIRKQRRYQCHQTLLQDHLSFVNNHNSTKDHGLQQQPSPHVLVSKLLPSN